MTNKVYRLIIIALCLIVIVCSLIMVFNKTDKEYHIFPDYLPQATAYFAVDLQQQSAYEIYNLREGGIRTSVYEDLIEYHVQCGQQVLSADLYKAMGKEDPFDDKNNDIREWHLENSFLDPTFLVIAADSADVSLESSEHIVYAILVSKDKCLVLDKLGNPVVYGIVGGYEIFDITNRIIASDTVWANVRQTVVNPDVYSIYLNSVGL